MIKILVATLIITAFNTGLIWTIQVVHYPGFIHICEPSYKTYQNLHMKRILFIVGPAMLAELILSGYLFVHIQGFWYLISALLLLFIWIHTAFIASPIHGKLTKGFNQSLIHRLIRVNWWRTIAWTIRLVILSWISFSLLNV